MTNDPFAALVERSLITITAETVVMGAEQTPLDLDTLVRLHDDAERSIWDETVEALGIDPRQEVPA